MTQEERITARRRELENQLASIPSDGGLPASATQADLARNQQQRATIERQLAQFDAAVSTHRALGSAADDEKWLAELTEWRQVLVDERMAIKSPIRDPREKGREQNLALSIRCIDRGPDRTLQDSIYSLTTLRLGELMREAGYEVKGADPATNYAGKMPWHGSMPEVEKRIAALAEKRAQADASLEAALMSDEERERQEAEAARLRDAYNSMTVKHGSDANAPCLVAYRNGEVFPVDEMSPLQRTAFERADAAIRAAHRHVEVAS